ncbi:MAG: FecR family protein [Chitinophagaceae bacterium]|nr:FecR family protein [Chitinophagaceae bacterium]
MNTYSEKRFYDLLGRKLSGEADKDELIELRRLLTENNELQFLHDWVFKRTDIKCDEEELQGAYLAHSIKMADHAKSISQAKITVRGHARKLFVKLSFAAAAVLAIAFIWSLIGRNTLEKNVVETTAATDAGSKSKMTLPDGSVVYLNSKSNLRYDKSFGRTNRDIWLTGEAYFDVTHNEKLPFVVHTSEASIKVLGTVFNVRDYVNEPQMEAALLKGSIEVKLLKDDTKIIHLKPTEKIIIDKGTLKTDDPGPPMKNAVQLTNIGVADSVIVETSWVEGKIAFIDKPLSDIASQLENRYGVTISIKNPKLKTYKYTGVFDDTEVNTILDILQMVKPFKYKYEEKNYIIY